MLKRLLGSNGCMSLGHTGIGMFAGGGPGIAHRPGVSMGFGARARHFSSGGALATPACHWGLITS